MLVEHLSWPNQQLQESGYQAQFLPILQGHRQPLAPAHREHLRANPFDFESSLCSGHPIYIETMPQAACYRRNHLADHPPPNPDSATYPAQPPYIKVTSAAEYMAFWYVGFIPPGAVRQEGTGMPDEAGYVGHLLPYKEALSKLGQSLHAMILSVAIDYVRETEEARVHCGKSRIGWEEEEDWQQLQPSPGSEEESQGPLDGF